MDGVIWLLVLVTLSTVWVNLFGNHVDQLFWNFVSLITIPTLLWMLSFKNATVGTLYNKFSLMLFGVLNFIVSRDKSWKTQPDPELIKTSFTRSKKIIFIRHGESDWNLIFNKGLVKMPFRLVAAAVRELFLLVLNDSVFYDSPLNKEGQDQAKELQSFVENEADAEGLPEDIRESVAVLRGSSDKSSVVVASNLRRAIATTCIGLWGRLQRTQEKVVILSSLQEISRNVDTLSITQPKQFPEGGRIRKAVGSKFYSEGVFDVAENTGNKPLLGNGLSRLLQFASWCFDRDEDVIIVGGHSLYFRYFFKTFLPHHIDHVAKVQKIKNSGVISFTLTSGLYDGRTLFRIEPSSVKEVFLGFDDKKKKK